MKVNINIYFIIIATFFMLSISRSSSVAAQSINCVEICDIEWSPTEEDLLAVVTEIGLWLHHVNDMDSTPILYQIENVTSLSFSPNGDVIAVTSCIDSDQEDSECHGMVSIFNIETESWREIARFDYGLKDIQFSPDGTKLAMIQDKPSEWGLNIIDLSTMESVQIVDRKLTNLIIDYDISDKFAVISNGSTTLAFAGITLWNLDTGKVVAKLDIYDENIDQKYISEIAFWNDSSTVALVNSEAQLTLWEVEANRLASTENFIDTYYEPFHNFELIPSTQHLLAALAQDNLSIRVLSLWDLQSMELVFTADLPSPTLSTTLLDMNSTHSLIAISGFDEKCAIYVFDIALIEFTPIC